MTGQAAGAPAKRHPTAGKASAKPLRAAPAYTLAATVAAQSQLSTRTDRPRLLHAGRPRRPALHALPRPLGHRAAADRRLPRRRARPGGRPRREHEAAAPRRDPRGLPRPVPRDLPDRPHRGAADRQRGARRSPTTSPATSTTSARTTRCASTTTSTTSRRSSRSRPRACRAGSATRRAPCRPSPSGSSRRVIQLVTVLTITFFLLLDGGRIANFLLAQVRREHQERVRAVAGDIYNATGGYVAGAMTLATAAGDLDLHPAQRARGAVRRPAGGADGVLRPDPARGLDRSAACSSPW